MYSPPYFQSTDEKLALQVIQENGFATVITTDPKTSALEVSHLPILLKETPEGALLLGHLARGNPHWKMLETGKTQIIFHGPHTYITPQWYPDPENVPTWNYVVAHAHGPCKLIQDPLDLLSDLQALVAKYESKSPTPWNMDRVSPELIEGLSHGIVGFRMKVEKIEGKYKLSQNRTPEDRIGVFTGLQTRTDDQSQNVLSWMKQFKYKN